MGNGGQVFAKRQQQSGGSETAMAKTILIIDDEASIRESLSGILADEGFLALSAEDGQQGLSLLEDEQVDLVLLDIWMPGLDGLEVLKRIKETQAELPVIMISGHGTIETAVDRKSVV